VETSNVSDGSISLAMFWAPQRQDLQDFVRGLNAYRNLVVKCLIIISSLYVCMAIKHIIVLFVETPRKFITAKLSIRKPGLLALMKIRAYGSKALQ
jgi:hypothetical protein